MLFLKHFTKNLKKNNVAQFSMRNIPSCVEISSEVTDALKNGKAVVALESTVITHGLPFPHNLDTAKLLEKVVQENGAIPATIALMNGKIKIGLKIEELEKLSNPKEKKIKTSIRDLPNVLEQKLIGGTTVASTMKLANMVGIRVFATGGIGGVHRGASETFDISADLIELGKTPVAVVCAGAKSILDISKTLEFLETQSCNIIVYSNEPFFPGFFTKKTTKKVSFFTEDLNEISRILLKTDELRLKHGTLIACPPPSDEGEIIEKQIQQAILECQNQKISSKNVTPFILAKVNELTKGKSMNINIQLLKNNAKIAANLAQIYSEMKTKKSIICSTTKNIFDQTSKKRPRVLSVGAAIVDFEIITNENVKNDGGSYKGRIIQRCGGVGRNHAEALGRLGCESTFLTSIGNDDMAEFLFKKAIHYDLGNANISKNVPTATYMSVNVCGNIVHGFSAIEDAVANITPNYIKSKEQLFENRDLVVIDANLKVETISAVIDIAKFNKIKIWFEPTDLAKATKIIANENLEKIDGLSPNFNEMIELGKTFGMKPVNLDEFKKHLYSDFLSETSIFKTAEMILRKMKAEETTIFVTMGPIGTLALKKTGKKIITRIVASPMIGINEQIISASGAGDTFNSGFLASQLFGKSFEDSLESAVFCAKESLMHVESVPETLTPKLIGIF